MAQVAANSVLAACKSHGGWKCCVLLVLVEVDADCVLGMSLKMAVGWIEDCICCGRNSHTSMLHLNTTILPRAVQPDQLNATRRCGI